MSEDKRDSFRRAMARFGGRVEFEKGAGTPAGNAYALLAREALDLIEDTRRFLPKLPPIHFDFVATGDVNAYAFKYSEEYFIGITSGAGFMLQLIFSRMMRDCQILPHILDPRQEVAALPPMEVRVNADIMQGRGQIPVMPTSAGRSDYADYLFHRAMMFLLGHEITHIPHGHVDYLAAKGASGFMAELEWVRDGEESILERQALEFDADVRSAFSGMASVVLGMQSLGGAPPAWSSTPLSFQDLLFAWAFAINSLFRLFGDVRFAAEGTRTAHPPLPIRRMVVTMAADRTTKVDGLLEGGILRNGPGPNWDMLKAAVVESESAFEAITGRDRSAFGIQDAFSKEGMVSPAGSRGTTSTGITGYQEPTWWRGDIPLRGPVARGVA